MAAKKGSKQKPILLGALKRAIPAIKDDEGRACVHFSISKDGNLMLSGSGPNGSTEEEIPEALALKPGGPGLMVGEFGVVNLSSEPFDFEISALQLLPALKQGKTDPSIIFHGLEKPIEFAWPNYKFLVMHAIQEAAVR